MALLAGQDSAASFADTEPAWKAELLARAVARARLAGADASEAVARRAWETAHVPAVASALSDLPLGAEAAWPDGRPDTAPPARAANGRAVRHRPRSRGRARRRAAGRAGNGAGDLRQRHRHRSGAAGGLDGDPARRARGRRRAGRSAGAGAAGRGGPRSGRGGGAARGGGRAPTSGRGGWTTRSPRSRSASSCGPTTRRPTCARTSCCAPIWTRPGRAMLFDALLSHRLAAAPLTPAARVALLFERGQHRVQKVDDRPAAFADFKEILKIQPEHREALFQLARGASEDRDRGVGRPLAGAVPGRGVRRRARARGAAGSGDLLRGAQGSRARHGDPAARGRPAARRSQAAPSSVGPVPAAGRVEGRRSRRCGRRRRAFPTAPNGRPCTCASDRSCAISGATRRARRRRSGVPPSSIRWGKGRARWWRCTTPRAISAARCDTVDHEVADVRRALAADPLDVRRLERLGELLEMAGRRGSSAPIAEAAAAVASVLDSGEGRGDAGTRPPAGRTRSRPRPRARSGRSWPIRRRGDSSGELWPNLAEAAMELFPAPARARQAASRSLPARSSGSPGSRPAPPRWASPGCTSRCTREPGAAAVTALEEPGPVVLLRADAENSLATRFQVGRALGILAAARDHPRTRRARTISRPLFACAALMAGVALPAGLPKPSEDLLRTVARAVGRKQRKALTLQASRFNFEKYDLAAWHEGVLRTADRLGLMMAGDVGASALTLVGGGGANERGGIGGATSPRTPPRWICSGSRSASSIRRCGRRWPDGRSAQAVRPRLGSDLRRRRDLRRDADRPLRTSARCRNPTTGRRSSGSTT